MKPASTPMMSQYRRIRSGLAPDTILFFRLGDFYEMFFEDAKKAAPILDIALTRRNNVPMCGVPYHAAESYLARLIRAGLKVAVCDQVEDPSAARGIVRREITRIVTPGTVLEGDVLESRRNNFLAALHGDEKLVGLALLDISTGEFTIEEDQVESIRAQFAKYAPAECLVAEADREEAWLQSVTSESPGTLVTPYEDWIFDYDAALDYLTRHFRVHSLEGYGCGGARTGLGAAGAVLHYVSRELRRNVEHVRSIHLRNPRDFMILDETTVANLELLKPRSSSAPGEWSLLGILDSTRTPMGARLLRQWILRPLASRRAIEMRHEAVTAFVGKPTLMADVRETLGEIRDLQRLLARLTAGGGNARDVVSLGRSLGRLPHLREVLLKTGSAALEAPAKRLQDLPELVAHIERAIVEEPPAVLREGGIIREGYDAELDELRRAARDGRRWIAEYQAREQERTGIKSLKVRHNKVFGYYIEVTKPNLALVPDEYQRKQTLVNAERFITPELKDYENRILGSQERARELEYEIFVRLRGEVVASAAVIQADAEAVAEVDVLCSLAERARSFDYVRPRMTDSDVVKISAGRHPVVERIPGSEAFVPNDTLLDNSGNQLVIITGPNMAGKSTYIRQVALIVIMAQIGSFVPAAEAEIGVVDRVFTRVGASDDLAGGRSTFMVEMQETANILHNATPASLVVLDEIGRGTSTFDGISIAWAVAEYLHNNPRVKAKTLFATHYHELTDLALTMAGVKNYNVLVRESGDGIAFLRRIVPGAADKSYGIQVARLAGLPQDVVDRASEILRNLEEGEFEEEGRPRIARRRGRRLRDAGAQMELFDGGALRSGA